MTRVIPAFPKIFHLGDRHIYGVLDTPVEITEKIDGSQFSFGVIDGELQYRSKGKTSKDHGGMDENMFGPIIEHVKAFSKTLPEGVVFHGEYLKTPQHNTLKYSRIPKNYFSLFGIRDLKDDTCASHPLIRSWARTLEVDAVPLIFEGKWDKSAESIIEFTKKESYLGGCQMEGVVVKNYNMKGEFAGKELPLVAAKFVSEEFKEKHLKNPEYSSKKDKVVLIGEQLRAPARWAKAVHNLRDNGELEGTPKDIGKLFKYVAEDMFLEETDWIKDQLLEAFQRDIKKISTGGLAQWYKEYLVKQSEGNQEYSEAISMITNELDKAGIDYSTGDNTNVSS